jgi:predicted anti-sigma-YlaC factor YlaD
MKVTHEVILDLLPLYLEGEASPATRQLVEEYLAEHPDLARQVRSSPESLGLPVAPLPSPEIELDSLRRTRRMIALQRWLFGFAICFTSIGLVFRIQFHDGRLSDAGFVFLDHPRELVPFLLLAAACWIGYITLKRRLRL